ncbi:nucleoside 2-deoxyribosyltransferase [Herbaspirillum autotrophicum]|uniref:nucleoside 2-deoxyribosyltransferase n=1 Tax=Herbaspirillum autotrophicum TaxID=180195 RepID=UPI000A5C14E3|nr:nucleoside 2-deoxyribosyltransferase [Herbaspirillum autotrophicum]
MNPPADKLPLAKKARHAFMSKKIYLAGFDVFRADAVAHGLALKQVCERFGFEGLYPLDNACPGHLSAERAARWIYDANIALIRQADMLVANLNNFRGYEPDSGTCFEIGFAQALKIPTWAYCSQRNALAEQIPHKKAEDGQFLDEDGYLIEDFNLPRNLMLSCSTEIVHGDIEDCLRQISLRTTLPCTG